MYKSLSIYFGDKPMRIYCLFPIIPVVLIPFFYLIGVFREEGTFPISIVMVCTLMMIILVATSSMFAPVEDKAPGWKYFRTIPDGFGHYKRAQLLNFFLTGVTTLATMLLLYLIQFTGLYNIGLRNTLSVWFEILLLYGLFGLMDAAIPWRGTKRLIAFAGVYVLLYVGIIILEALQASHTTTGCIALGVAAAVMIAVGLPVTMLKKKRRWFA